MVRSSCISACIIGLLAGGSALAQSNDAPASRAGRSSYTVDGLALGARFDAQSPSGRGYQCSPSEQFPEFTRCQRTQRQQGAWGRRSFDSISSILHSGDGKAVYINRYIGPWVFDRNEIQTEINRLSSRFGERAREMRMPQREGLPSGIIASWGQVALEQLDGDAVSVLASGQSPRKGLLIDYLGDLRRSAQLGLPIYSIHGGAGYLWAASAERSGRGHIRFLTVDASAFTPPTEKPQPATEANTQAQVSEATPAEMPQAAPAIARAQPEQASVDTEVAKAEVENAPVAESAVADTTETQQVSTPEREKALFARLEAQLARAEATNRMLETWAYRTVAGLVLLLIAAAVLLRTWRRKTRATSAQARKTAAQPASSPISIPQGLSPFAGQSAATLVPQDASPLAIAAETQAKPANSHARASSLQTCSSCQDEISREDKFCRHCGTAVAAPSTTSKRLCSSCREEIGSADTFCRYCGASSIAVASPSMACNGERADAGENAVKAALFGDAKPA